jgi:nitrile hydratase beta subunit
MGGMHGFGPVMVPGCDRVSDDPWELRVFALSAVIDAEGLGAGGGRPMREELAPAEYLAMSYYERWVFSTEQKVLRKGVVTQDELDGHAQRVTAGKPAERRESAEQVAAVLADLAAPVGFAEADSPAFAPGDRVHVRRMRPQGHTRCPRYVRGATGTVETVRGADRLPDIGPYRGPMTPVYAVAFRSDDLFGPSDEGTWAVVLDLFEAYLEAA